MKQPYMKKTVQMKSVVNMLVVDRTWSLVSRDVSAITAFMESDELMGLTVVSLHGNLWFNP